ncbi:ImmA/IrrE family metallo-endopeptidase [Bifidobacterium aquikefiri]|uniref:ImmA/IrrE family metallo-endopeptidase n=1 Tax=Bifidobacterium aquikefiri TaxID=1653207 RepID=UPI0039EB7368
MIDVESLALPWARVVTLPMEAGIQGAFDRETSTIFLASNLSDMQRACVLAHEISHAKHRDHGCYGHRSPMERRADMDAARLLINPVEYATAELVCDNVVWLARELNVMPYIIRAYREWLHEHPEKQNRLTVYR